MSKGKAGRRGHLTRERVLEAAVELADQAGLERLSMRRLGDALGVEAMSLYKHVANKGEILDGITEVTGKAGSILLISSHSGDLINGRAAVMMAEDLGIRTVPLPMYDDISSAPPERKHDRQGAPGTMFIYKILGAAAEKGVQLEELLALGEAVRERLVTLAAAVSPPVSPLTGDRMFSLPDDEIYLGMGVHGEPGVGRLRSDRDDPPVLGRLVGGEDEAQGLVVVPGRGLRLALAPDGGDDFLVAAKVRRAFLDNLDLPALGVGKPLVHAKQVTGKNSCLITAGTGTNLEEDVVGIMWVFRQQQGLQGLVQLRQ